MRDDARFDIGRVRQWRIAARAAAAVAPAVAPAMEAVQKPEPIAGV